ncbi:MAG: PaaI family thioesterase [Rhizobacter sp.]|nr:PaaI family thioesterase [Rhizobacter sp.]
MKFKVRIPFVEALGFELLRFDNGQAEIAMTPKDEHLNSWSVLHGGVAMTLLDVAMAHAARSVGVFGNLADAPEGAASPPDPRGVVTVEMKTSFMRPGVGRVIAHGKVLTQTHTLAFCEGSLLDAKGVLVAHATGTFKYLKALPVGKRQLKRLNASD